MTRLDYIVLGWVGGCLVYSLVRLAVIVVLMIAERRARGAS